MTAGQGELFAKRSKTGLLPCPFCGSIQLSGLTLKPEGKQAMFIQCQACGATGPIRENMAGARALWDSRSSEA